VGVARCIPFAHRMNIDILTPGLWYEYISMTPCKNIQYIIKWEWLAKNRMEIDNAAQYNKRIVALRKPTNVDICILQTDKWAWLHVCLQKVNRCGSQKKL